jgi:glycosyltransferase involved in cell wall biosynthesis
MAESCDRIVRSLRHRGVLVDVAHLTRRRRPWRVDDTGSGRLLTCPLDDDPEHALHRLWTALDGDAVTGALTHVVAFGGTYPLLAAPVYAAWLGLPLVTLLRGNDFDTGVFSVRRRAVVADALQRSARICVVSRGNVRKITALYPGTAVEWIPNGIDAADWEALDSDRAAAALWRASVVPDGRRVIGMVGHLKRKKGALLFLETLLASGRAGAFHVALVGEVEEPVLGWLDAHRADVSVSVQPFLDRYALLRLYPAFDLVALPSFYDGLPNVALEAAALGIPVLSSTAGGLGDIFEDGVHGFTFTAGDSHSLHAAIERAAVASVDELAALGHNGASLVRDELTHAVEAERYLELLRRTRQGRQTPYAHRP